MEIKGTHVVLRGATERDVPDIAEIMRCPSVAYWWGRFDVEEFTNELSVPASHPLVIERAGEAVGYIQYDEEHDPMYRHAQIDIALHDAHQGRGFGTDAVRTLARYLFDEVGHHRLTIDPAATNERAIRCYERVGFRPVGVMRDYERGPDGSWHDGLLMDLLASELL
jgi:aminoglycoside 6'-N-acetyltransferase